MDAPAQPDSVPKSLQEEEAVNEPESVLTKEPPLSVSSPPTHRFVSNNPVTQFITKPELAPLAPVIQNVVATLNVQTELELKTIALRVRNTEYNPNRFGAVIMRIRDPKTTALIFKSGKIVCTGARTLSDSRFAARKYVCILKKLGFDAQFTEFCIQNIVASFDFQCPIRLEALLVKHAKFCSYEPELFPGLVYRIHSPRVVLLIFVSGKVVITGAKKPEDVAKGFEMIYPVLNDFKK